MVSADVDVAPKGKQTPGVKKEGWALVKKVFASVTKPTVFKVKLVDAERVAVVGAVARARARYDKVATALEQAEAKLRAVDESRGRSAPPRETEPEPTDD